MRNFPQCGRPITHHSSPITLIESRVNTALSEEPDHEYANLRPNPRRDGTKRPIRPATEIARRPAHRPGGQYQAQLRPVAAAHRGTTRVEARREDAHHPQEAQRGRG